MGLRVVHHLQAMLHLAVVKVKLGQLAGHLGRNPPLFGKCCKAAKRRAVAQIGVAASGDQLAGLGEEFDLADAAHAQLHVVAFDRDGTVQLAMVTDAQAHVVGVLNRCKIKVFAPDKGRQGFQEPVAGGDVAPARTRLDIGGPLPRSSDTFVIAFGSGHR
jgi:hypothetical protein